MEKNFDVISIEFRKEIQKDLELLIVKNFQKEVGEGEFREYEVPLQSIRFVTRMTDDELRKSIALTIDLMEELKVVNNSGMNAEKLKEKAANIESSSRDELLQQIAVWKVICNEKIYEIIREMNAVRRVGGAYAMLISNPCFKSAMYAVYDKIVDNFDDEELYYESAYFLVRAVMRMHCREM